MSERSKGVVRRVRPAGWIVAACLLLPLISTQLPAEGWCDMVFTDILDEADSVVIAGYRQEGGDQPRFTVQEVLKGECTDAELDLDPRELEEYRLKDGDQLVLALTSYHQPVRVVRGMGGCTAVSILPIRGGKLRSRDRESYDFGAKSLSLDALRSQLLSLLQPDSS